MLFKYFQYSFGFVFCMFLRRFALSILYSCMYLFITFLKFLLCVCKLDLYYSFLLDLYIRFALLYSFRADLQAGPNHGLSNGLLFQIFLTGFNVIRAVFFK